MSTEARRYKGREEGEGGRDGHGWFALAGVDVEAAVGPSTLKIGVKLDGGGSRDLSRTVEIHEAHYRTGTLTVAPKFVEPDLEEMKRIEADGKIKAKIFTASAQEPLWRGDFRRPVTAAATDSFGVICRPASRIAQKT